MLRANSIRNRTGGTAGRSLRRLHRKRLLGNAGQRSHCRPRTHSSRSSTRSIRTGSSRSELRCREAHTRAGSPGCRSRDGAPRTRSCRGRHPRRHGRVVRARTPHSDKRSRRRRQRATSVKSGTPQRLRFGAGDRPAERGAPARPPPGAQSGSDRVGSASAPRGADESAGGIGARGARAWCSGPSAATYVGGFPLGADSRRTPEISAAFLASG